MYVATLLLECGASEINPNLMFREALTEYTPVKVHVNTGGRISMVLYVVGIPCKVVKSELTWALGRGIYSAAWARREKQAS